MTRPASVQGCLLVAVSFVALSVAMSTRASLGLVITVWSGEFGWTRGFISSGGAMGLIRPVFRMGLGGRLGSGRQWMSCIHVEDVAGMILWALHHDAVTGPLNAVMPGPVTNAEFTKLVAASVRRPAMIPVPSIALKAALGELSHVLLDSSRVLPGAAVKLGYPYRFSTLAEALQALPG